MLNYFEFTAMNTSVLMAAEGDRKTLEPVFGQAEGLVRAYEQRFTRFSPVSELSALNRTSGEWFNASQDLFEVVSLSLKYFRLTGGLFNPGILGALEMAGYDRTYDDIRAAASLKSLPGPLLSPVADFDRVELDPARCRIRLPERLRIDLGGIAKGWIAEQACLFLNKFSAGCAVNAGGDQFACGLPHGADEDPSNAPAGWLVALEDPFDPLRDAAVLNVPPGALCTSTTTRRAWLQDGKPRHHLIDPRSGIPAEASWVSVTVNAESAAEAEVLAKALLIGGPDAAPRLLARFPKAAVIAIDRESKLWGSTYGQRLLAKAENIVLS